MSNRGDLFESYIQFIYQTLLGAQGKNISVSRGATVYDNRGNRYNIDVFYEFDVAGVHHRVAIECKTLAAQSSEMTRLLLWVRLAIFQAPLGFLSQGTDSSQRRKNIFAIMEFCIIVAMTCPVLGA